MKMKQIAGLCILIPALLSGCGNQTSSGPAAASTTQPQTQNAQGSADAKQQGQNRPAMSQEQRQLFSTFQTLLMMDKADGLAITKEQAQVMLPVAQDIETKAELSDENKTKLLEKLTDAQKKFIDDSASRMAGRGNGGGNGPGANGGNQGDGKRGNFGGQKGAQPDGSAPASPNAAGSDGTGGGNNGNGAARGGNADGKNGGAGGNRPAGGAGGQMRDPGKQLVELLQERVK
ncbi:hypothetical protein [Paenibacillus planticolens]|uniref:Uncharacterized protein n=1 Tax=Paenibacillus planticolens TaxID=2654976 RepID=A0ABX1ZNM4_9BACL|nr:hypothetical protein [Paenibacillus planticolens]NOV01551.1 hypothetical protein [Paenibacillus planticolens]